MSGQTRPPELARTIQQQRRLRNMSLDELARRSGVSKAMLSQVEADKANPTVLTVWKIARGLDMDLHELLRPGSHGRFDLHEASEAVMLDHDEGRCSIQVIAPHRFADEQEIYILRFQEGGSLCSDAHFPGTEELLTCLDGSIEVRSGGLFVCLGGGDSLHYSADVSHSIESAGNGQAVAFLLVRLNRP